MKKIYQLLVLSLFIVFCNSCKKDTPDYKNPSSPTHIFLSKGIGTFNDTATIYYDEQNNPLKVLAGRMGTWVSRVDAKNNIIEVRDTGLLTGGFGPITYVRAKTIFTYNGQNEIIRKDDYNLNGVASDTTRPNNYEIYSYDNDTLSIMYYYHYDGTDFDKLFRTEKLFFDASQKVVGYQSITDTASKIPLIHYFCTYEYTTDVKNPLALLPKALLLTTTLSASCSPIAFNTTPIVSVYSTSVPNKVSFLSQSFSSYYGTNTTLAITSTNAFLVSSTAKDYPQMITQTTDSKFTVPTTGAVTETTKTDNTNYEYLIK